MTGAMYAAVAGLRAHMSALNVIGHNISNVNTNAYKSARYTFLESLYSTVRGGSNGSGQVGGKNPAQMGYGSSIGTIDLDMSTKNFTPTGHATDVMIDGDGFIMVGDKGKVFNSEEDVKGLYLTRHGDLAFGPDGYLTDGQGNVVYGFLSVENPVYTKVIEDNTDQTTGAVNIPPLPKDGLKEDDAGEYYMDNGELVQIVKEGDVLSKKVIDQYTPSPVLTAIRAPRAGTGALTVTVPGDPGANPPVPDSKKALYSKGDPIYPHYDPVTGTIVDAPEDADVSGRIDLNSVSIDENTGRITCTTQNGKAVVIGTIAIAKVSNPNGVTHVNGRYYQALDGAGDMNVCSIGNSVLNSDDPDSPFYAPDAQGVASRFKGEVGIRSGGTSKFVSGGLESSGTDLASEISNMIMVQRGYQANTRIVTVTDSMLEELVNMKR